MLTLNMISTGKCFYYATIPACLALSANMGNVVPAISTSNQCQYRY